MMNFESEIMQNKAAVAYFNTHKNSTPDELPQSE
jgi:hypothetical protein